jgi:hypothetical protein
MTTDLDKVDPSEQIPEEEGDGAPSIEELLRRQYKEIEARVFDNGACLRILHVKDGKKSWFVVGYN